MSIQRIKAILLQELYITRHSLEVLMDLFYFSIVNIIVFGFVSIYLAGSNNPLAAHYILLGMILWEIIRVTQYSISVGSLWNIWSRNLSNMFVTPLDLKEYMAAAMLAGAVKTIIILVLIGTISHFIFNFNILNLGILNLFLFFINLTIFAWSVGIIILGIIFRYGTRIQALAWGIIFIFQPLTAVFFPVSILPKFMQWIAYSFPPTYIFEAARLNISNQSTDWQYIYIAFAENIFYFILALIFFNVMFNKSKETGQFARNEG
ncbi:MAG: ABC transporter permease [Patescibacteria group bacterium]